MATSKNPPPPPKSPGSAPAGNTALIDALKALKRAIKGIPANLGVSAAGLGGLGSRIGGGMQSGAASTQAIAASVKQMMAQASTQFAGAMGTASTGVARAFEKAFDATIGRGIDLLGKGFIASAKVAKKAWQNPIGFAAGAGRSAKNFGSNVRSGWRRSRRALGRGVRGLGRRARYAKIRGLRAFHRSRSVVGGFRAGGSAILGALGLGGLVGSIGAIGPALSSVMSGMRLLVHTAERNNEANRHLGHYNGRIGAAFGRLDIGDQYRDFHLARATEGTAVSLAESVNSMRNAQSGINRLITSLSNRAGIAAGELVTPGLRTLSDIANWATNGLDQADPNGRTTKAWSKKPLDNTTYGVGWIWGLLSSGGNIGEAERFAREAVKEQERMRQAAVKPVIDGWSKFAIGSQNLNPLRPKTVVTP